MSSRPNARTARATKPAAPSTVDTSAASPTASPPASRMSCAAASARAESRPHSTTRTPSAASACAQPSPSPPDAPATAAHRPAIPRSIGPKLLDLPPRSAAALHRVNGVRAGSRGAPEPPPQARSPVQNTTITTDDRRRSPRSRRDRIRTDDERFRTLRATGDRALRNTLIEDHRWLALHCARRFAGKGEPLDDLIQVAMLGVLKAVERFDPDYGATFATFAVPTITGELRRHFRDTTWAVHVPRRSRDLQHTVKVAVGELGHAFGRSPTAGEVAEHTGVPVEEVLDALEAARCYRNVPLTSGGDDDDGDLGNIGEDDDALDAVDARLTVERLLRELPARERRIVELRYMSGLTQSQIAAIVGVSQVQVSRLLRASLAHMNASLEEPSRVE